MYAANIEIGWINKWFKGENAIEIMEQVEQYQDFGCLLRMGAMNENAKGKKQLAILEEFIDKYYSGELTIEELSKLNISLSIGDIVCHEVLEGEAAESK